MRGGVVLTLFALVAATTSAEVGAQTPAPSGSMVALVTGSTGGLGREVARQLASEGAHVIIHGRSAERGQALVDEITAAGVGSAHFIAADLGSFDEVRELARTVLEEYDRLDLLVSNAGIWLDGGGGRQVSSDGHELHLQVNYLSGFLLTRMLLPMLRESAPARIIQVSSIAQRPIDFEDPMLEQSYDASRAYAQSKLAQILFTVDLAEELEGTGVIPLSLHPATLMDTDMVLERGIEPRSSVEDGLRAVMNLVHSDDVEAGGYHQGLRSADPNAQALDAAARERLRNLSYRLTGAPEG